MPDLPKLTEPTPAPDDLPILDPSELRAAQLIRVDIGGGRAVLARRADLTAMVFEGVVPMPLLNAVQHLTSGLAALGSMAEQDRTDMIEMFRKHACRVVVQPTITMTDDDDPTHLPVRLLHINQLMSIWEATTTASIISAVAASRFRTGTTSIPISPTRDGEDVRPSTEQLAPEPSGQVTMEYA